MSSPSPYLDGLLKLVLRVFSGGSYVASVGGGTTGLNVNAPLAAVPNPTTGNVDVGLPSVPLSLATGILPGPQVQSLADPGLVYRSSFTVVLGYMHPYDFTAANQVINFPAITALLAGQAVALMNQGTGATGCTLVPNGADSLGIVPGTGATANGVATGAAVRITPCFTTHQWVPGI